MTQEKPKTESVDTAPEVKKVEKKRKNYKSVPFAIVRINCSFNNTIVTITDERGGTLAWHTAGACGFRGTKKGTPFAAQITASKAIAKVADRGVREVAVMISGPGPGRETAIRAVQASGIKVVSIKDVTPIPHNGCRPPKARRV